MKTPERLGLSALQAVRSPRAVRKLTAGLCVLFAILPPLLAVVPWQQNVQAQGRVTAVDPLDRVQVLPAPVTGRLDKLFVQEGDRFTAGQVLARMTDQDPDYAQRLERKVELANREVEAAESQVQFYADQIESQKNARRQAILSAEHALEVAKREVTVAERELDAERAQRDQKKIEFEVKKELLDIELVAALDFQKAKADYASAEQKVEAAIAKVEKAKSYRDLEESDLEKVEADQDAKISKIESDRQDAVQKANKAKKEFEDANRDFERQKTQEITAPRSGTVMRVYAASNADFLIQGAPLIEWVPDSEEIAVELWVRGIDAPLITPGREVRLQFEGWPAVQFAGWPSVAVGTFGGRVLFVDAQGNTEGRFRVLIEPDPEDEPWPDRTYLRQGARVNGWLMLDTVSLGYEIWRNLNAFPPSVDGPPEEGMNASQSKAKPAKKSKDK